MKKRTRCAPSLRTFEETQIRTACDPQLLRRIWKAKDKTELASIVEVEDMTLGLAELRRSLVAKHAGYSSVEHMGVLSVAKSPGRVFEPPQVWICRAETDLTPTLVFVGVNMQISTERVMRGRIYGSRRYSRQLKGRGKNPAASGRTASGVSERKVHGHGNQRDFGFLPSPHTDDSGNATQTVRDQDKTPTQH